MMPTDIDGPHGVAVSPDKEFYYVSIAQGSRTARSGSTRRKTTGSSAASRLGMFPATLDVTPDGDFLFVVNFNLHGDMVPSSVSVVATEDDGRDRAHPDLHDAARLAAQRRRARKQYSACMMDDMLVEIDTATLRSVAALHAHEGDGSRDERRADAAMPHAGTRAHDDGRARHRGAAGPATSPARRPGRSRRGRRDGLRRLQQVERDRRNRRATGRSSAAFRRARASTTSA